MDSYDRKDLLLCIEGLGRQVKLESDDGEETILVYQKGPDSLGCLQDIQRFLRRDDLESKSFHIQLGTWNVLSAHLLPMLASYRDSHEYAFEIVKLMVMLTMPAEAKMRDPTEYNRRLAVYLESFVNHDILAILMSISAGPLSRGGAQRTHNDIQVLELILTLIRNLLSIVPTKSNVREELLFAMDKESILLLLLHIASQIEASENARFSLIVLETFHLLFANQDPLVIASITEPHPIPVQSIQEKSAKDQKERNLEESGLTIPSLHSSSASTSRPSPSPSSKQPMSARGAALGALLASSSPTKTSSAARHSRFGGYVLATPKIQPPITSAEILGQQTSYSASSVPVSGESARPGSQSVNGSSSTSSSSSTITTTAANNASSAQPGKKKPMPGVEFNQKDGSVASSMMSIMDVLNPKLQHAKGIHLGGGGRGMRTKSGGEDAQASKRSQHALASSSLLSGFSSKLILKNFAHRVLDHCFNELMRVIKALVESHSPNLMSNDLDNYVWAIGFFPAFLAGSFLFQRNGNADNFSFSPTSSSSAENPQSEVADPSDQSGSFIHLDIGNIHAIFEEETFNYLLEQLERYETEKVVSKVELHFLALKQLIYVLLAMHGSGSSEHVGIAEKIVLQLIYDPELLIDRLPRLVGTFAILKRGASLLLPPLIEGVHLLLTLLEKISDGGQKKLVQLKKRSKSTMDRGLLGSKEGDEEEAISKLDGDDDILDENEKDSAQGKEGNNANSMLVDEVDAQNSKRKTSAEDGVSDAYNGGRGDQDSEDDEFVAKAKRLKEELAMMEEADDDEDAANREKYFDVQDYYIWFFKKHVVDAIVTLLQSYETNLDRTNEAVIGILKRVETVEGLAMLFQVNHLRIIASILIEKTSVEEKIVNSHAVGSGASKESKEKVKAFCRRVAGDFLDSFYKDPVTIGLTTLWPKKLSRARDLVSGTYLTTDSYYDGTLEIQEEAWMREAQKALDWEMEHNMEPMEEDDDQLIPRRHDAKDDQEERRMHQKNPSSVRSSKNERARPYLAEGMQGNDGFDLSTVLRKPKEKEEEKKLKKQEESLALLRARRNQAQKLSGDSSNSTTLQPIVRRKKTAEERQEEAWAKIRSGADSSTRTWTAEETEEVKTLYVKYKDMARSGDLDVIALVKSMVSTKSFDETVCTLSDLYLQLEKILPAEEFQTIKRPELELEEEDVQEEKDATISSSYTASTRPLNRFSSMDIDHNINREALGHTGSTSLQIGRARASTLTRRSLYEEDEEGGGTTFSRANGSKSHGGSSSDVELEDDEEDEEAQVRPREMSRVKKGTNPTLIIRPHNVGGSTVLSSVNVTGGKTARQVLEEMAQRKREREEEEAKQREENALRRAEEKEARMKQRALRDEEGKLEREARRQAKIRAREEAKEAKTEQKAAAKEAKKQEKAQERAAKRLEKAENKKTTTSGTSSSASSKGRPLPSMEGIDEEDLMVAPKPLMDQSQDQGEHREIEEEEEEEEANALSAQLSSKQTKLARAKPRPKASPSASAASDNAESSSPSSPPARRPQRQASKRAAEASFFQRILAEQQEEEQDEEEDNNDNSDKDDRPIKTKSGSKRTTSSSSSSSSSSSQPINLLLEDEGEKLERGDSKNLPDSAPDASKATKKRKRPARMSNKDDDDDFTLDDEDNDEFNVDIYHDNDDDDDDDDDDARGTRSRKRGGKKSSAKKTGAPPSSSSSTPAKKKRKLPLSKPNDYYEDDIHPDDMDVLMARSDDDGDGDDDANGAGNESKRSTGSAKPGRPIASDWATTEEVPGEASTTISQKKRKLVRNTSRVYDDDDDDDDRSGEVGGKGVSSLNSSFQGTSTTHVDDDDDDDEIMLDD